jgi:hypothetical protein
MKSKEEILAKKLDDLLADSRIEPYLVGRYFAQSATLDVYDNFEEMVESARDEKQNRIEWIKDIIIGEKDMTTAFEAKCEILDSFQERYCWDTRESVSGFLSQHDLGVPLAMAYSQNWVQDIAPEGRKWVDIAFESLLELFGLEDTGWSDLIELEVVAEFEPDNDSDKYMD